MSVAQENTLQRDWAGPEDVARELWNVLPQHSNLEPLDMQDLIHYQINKVWEIAANFLEERTLLIRLLSMEPPSPMNAEFLYEMLEGEWDPETRRIIPRRFE